MLGNYYILARIMREFSEKTLGASLEKAYSSMPNELCLLFSNDLTLHIHAEPGHSYIYFKEEDFALPRQNFAVFFESIYGKVLSDIEISQTDKLYTLSFGDSEMVIRLYDFPNVILTHSNNVETFKKAKSISDSKPNSISKDGRLGNVLRKEFAFRGSKVEIDNTCECYIYTLPNSNLLLSPILLHHLGNLPYERFDSANEAAKRTLFYRAKNNSFISKKSKLTHELAGTISKLDETIRQTEAKKDDNSRAERYQEIADALMLVSYEYGKGLEEISLELSGQKEIVKLDPSITVVTNAEKYYGKARHSRSAKKDLLSKIDSFKQRLQTARSLYERIGSTTQESEIDKLREEALSGGFLHESSSKLASSESSFREFTVHGGFTVLVGKNAKQNDELTMHVANKEDIWLHARHVPGSHVIIKNRSRSEAIPKESIVEAAEIAAYYSDAKSQKVAPVAYTKRKYVRKPRKALPGQVLIEREEVVLVEPRLPTKEKSE
jgi:predicted ribosome quality control (RQC) complex YloA/Tae2 family protein